MVDGPRTGTDPTIPRHVPCARSWPLCHPGVRDAVCGLETGMRLGEIVGLKWPDVNLRSRVIRLSDTKNGTRQGTDENGLVDLHVP